jgi:hypothetical protein
LNGAQSFGQNRTEEAATTAHTSRDKRSLRALAEAACTAPISHATDRAYFLPYLGIKLGQPLRWGGNSDRSLGITPDQCSDVGKLLENAPIRFIMTHIISVEKGKAEGYFYLTSPDGGIIRVVHNCDHCAKSTALANPDDPVVIQDFNETVNFWLKMAKGTEQRDK